MDYRLFALAGVLALGPAAAEGQPAAAGEVEHVRVYAHILLVDRAEATRVGLRYVQVGGGMIGLDGSRPLRRGGGGGVVVTGGAAGVPVSAFIDLARDRGVLRSETRTQVLVVSGGSASVASGTASVGRWGTTRVRGPELIVSPTVLEDGRVLIDVRARVRDEVTGVYGYGADGSPVDVATTVVVGAGEEATVGSLSTSTQRWDTGVLRWASEAGDLDVLVVLRPEIVGRAGG
jgi:hypothetical protein